MSHFLVILRGVLDQLCLQKANFENFAFCWDWSLICPVWAKSPLLLLWMMLFFMVITCEIANWRIILSKIFVIRDWGTLKYFIGIKAAGLQFHKEICCGSSSRSMGALSYRSQPSASYLSRRTSKGCWMVLETCWMTNVSDYMRPNIAQVVSWSYVCLEIHK